MLPAVTVSCTSSGSTSGNKSANTRLNSVWFKSTGSPANVTVYSTTSNHVCPGGAGGYETESLAVVELLDKAEADKSADDNASAQIAKNPNE